MTRIILLFTFLFAGFSNLYAQTIEKGDKFLEANLDIRLGVLASIRVLDLGGEFVLADNVGVGYRLGVRPRSIGIDILNHPFVRYHVNDLIPHNIENLDVYVGAGPGLYTYKYDGFALGSHGFLEGHLGGRYYLKDKLAINANLLVASRIKSGVSFGITYKLNK